MLKKLHTSQMARLIVIFALISLAKISLYGNECCGKAEISAAYVHIDVLESGHTIHRMDLPAVKADLNWKIWSGLILKPTFIYGHGKHKDEILQAGTGIGFCYPVNSQFYLTPQVGFNYNLIKSSIDFENPFNSLIKFSISEKFQSYSPYVAFESSYTLCQGFRVVGTIQYAWSRTKTTLKPNLDPNFKKHSHSEGFTYSGMIEYDLNEHWSVNMGGAYNVSLTKEKHGMRIWGGKLGIAYWF
jgi:Protochlamydia outer membrane protein